MKIFQKIKKNKGFVILFAVTLSSIILAVALGVLNVAFKEIKFGTSVRNSDDGFFAADTGVECALMNDKPPSTSFASSGGSGTVSCLGSTIPLTGAFPSWSFVVSGLGSASTSCAKITIFKDTTTSPPYTLTSMVSKGYNIGDATCASTNPDRTERELDVHY